MAEGSYQVIFSGKIIEQADLNMVKANIARVFSMSAERVESLFSGRRIILKKNLDHATAEHYRVTLQRAGALCELEDTATSAFTSAEPVSSKPAAVSPDMSMANVGITLIEPTIVLDANIDTHDIDMAEAGIKLIETEPLADANIDTGDMNMAETGVTLGETNNIPDANIDTADMVMADVGVSLIEAKEFLAAEFDLGEMSMEEAGTQLVETSKIEPIDIDTSRLSLD